MTRLGVAITTKDRHEVAFESLKRHIEFWPENRLHGPHGDGFPGMSKVTMVVIDDGSRADFRLWLERHHPEEHQLWDGWIFWVRHDEPWGIARSKNHGIAVLMADGCTDLFLFDDDAYPIRQDWWMPYVVHPEGHLQFNYATGNGHDVALRELYRDTETIAYHASRGVMLYFSKAVIEAVGGMDPGYAFGFEHVEMSERIHNAGLTTWVAQSPRHDFFGDWPMIKALDEHEEVTSAITPLERRANTTPNLELLESHQGRTDFVPYHEPTNTVITCLFTGIPDPGEPDNPREPWPADPSLAQELLISLGYYANGPAPWAIPYVVLHNEDLPPLHNRPDGWHKVHLDETMNVYVARWVAIRQYLVTHPTIEKVWIVDCSDVEYLYRPHDPFAQIGPGKLYVGMEDRLCGDPWMLKHHPASFAWLTAHSRQPLYNAGVLGGCRNEVLQFIHHLLNAYRRAVVSDTKGEVGDMGYVQQAIGKMDCPVVAGPQITTVFKAYQHDRQSLWRHK